MPIENINAFLTKENLAKDSLMLKKVWILEYCPTTHW